MQRDDQTTTARAAHGRRWARVLTLAVAAAFGVLGGLGVFTFGYGDGAAYLSNDPSACANCHIMQPQYESYLRSSHQHVATCNDCHLAHDFVGKWVTKADNGFFHSLAFTTGSYPDPIRIKPRNRSRTQQACLVCHADFVPALRPQEGDADALLCVRCHSSVGHAQR